MDSRDLTPRQYAIMRDRLVPLTRLLHKWQHRMRQTEFPIGDALLLRCGVRFGRFRGHRGSCFRQPGGAHRAFERRVVFRLRSVEDFIAPLYCHPCHA
jgi:hypothetical protein